MANRPYIEPRLLGEGRGAKRAAEWEHPVAMQQRLSSQLGWEAFFSNVLALAQCEAVPGQDIPLKKPTATAGLGELFSTHSNFERHPVLPRAAVAAAIATDAAL